MYTFSLLPWCSFLIKSILDSEALFAVFRLQISPVPSWSFSPLKVLQKDHHSSFILQSPCLNAFRKSLIFMNIGLRPVCLAFFFFFWQPSCSLITVVICWPQFWFTPNVVSHLAKSSHLLEIFRVLRDIHKNIWTTTLGQIQEFAFCRSRILSILWQWKRGLYSFYRSWGNLFSTQNCI